MTGRRALLGLVFLPLFFCLFFSACLPARAVSYMPVTEKGAWSDWQAEPIEPGDNLEVESELRDQAEGQYRWVYSRYVYYNLDQQKWYCAPEEPKGDYVQAGTGYREVHKADEPLAVTGESAGETLYGDGWFHETVEAQNSQEQTRMYRSRAIRTVVCEISAKELLLFPEETRKLTANLMDGASAYQWSSSDESVARVDALGNVLGVAYGSAFVRARGTSGREVSCQVLVCQKGAKIPEGAYTLRLNRTGMALTLGKRVSSLRCKLTTQEYTGKGVQRFLLNNIGKNGAFTLSPLSGKSACVDILRGKGKPKLGNVIQVHKTRDRVSQIWKAIGVPDGSYIFYPKVDESLVLGAEPLEAGKALRLESMGDLEMMDRWVLVRTSRSNGPVAAFIRPVIRDGQSYVSGEFGENGREGLFIGSNGRRVYVLACAKGTVAEVFTDCTHDREKQADAQGAWDDPCGELGNYVVIDHGGGIRITYAHLSEVYVAAGDAVNQNTLIGRSGATGWTDSVGLYLELRENGEAKDPRTRIKLQEKDKPIE